jgi:hypothetical protein
MPHDKSLLHNSYRELSAFRSIFKKQPFSQKRVVLVKHRILRRHRHGFR